ncbi:Transposase for insertion sequence element IS231B [Bacillus pseudomycoides]|nr:Transposase for insertion sequence element IS231B [Bacillus pseudomycoides]
MQTGDLCIRDLGYFDLEDLMLQLQLGQTHEIHKAYIGLYQKLPTRVVLHRLTEEQTRKRWENQALKEKKKGIVMKERSKRLSAMNVYISNLPFVGEIMVYRLVAGSGPNCLRN